MNNLDHIQTWEAAKDFIKKNLKKGYLEYDPVGSGLFSKVFKVQGKPITIKVTTDSNEISFIQEKNLIKHNLKHIAKIYDMQIIDYNLAIIVKEYLGPLSEDISDSQISYFVRALYEPEEKVNITNPKLNANYESMREELDSISPDLEDLDIHKDQLFQDSKGTIKLVDF